jgi:transposase
MARKALREVMLTEEQRAVVARLVGRRDLAPRVRERLEMVKAVGLGQEVAAIAAWSGRSARTIGRWVRRFVALGVVGVADAPRSGRPAQADAAYLAALERAVETPPRDLGLPFDVWTSTRLGAYLAETTGVRITPGWLRGLLARRRFACGRPKHSLKHLQDPNDVARCERELADGEKKCWPSRNATSSTTRTRPTWRRTRC